VFLVLTALRELGGSCSKEEVLDLIEHRGLYEITRHDLPAYDGQGEPKYHTLLAWARKDALVEGWLEDTSERNAWQLSRLGREKLESVALRYKRGELNVRECYLWTPKFKKEVDRTYLPSSADRARPEELFAEFDA
jgi:hypothetical protein